MASRNAAIAEAVKTALNAAAADEETFGVTFVARRVWVPVTDPKDLTDLTVQIFFADEERENLRGFSALRDTTIQVGIQQRLTRTADPSDEAANAEIDALMEIAEKISDFFGAGEVGTTGAKFKSSKLNGPDPLQLLESPRVFAAYVTLVYKTANV